MHQSHRRDMPSERESGVVFVAMLVIVIPLVLTVGAFTSSMTARTKRLTGELDRERALLIAESGVDVGIWLGQAGYMADGLSFGYWLDSDSWFLLETTHLRVDGQDNDGDVAVDEPDEDVYQIVVTGHYRDTRRRVAAYLGPVPMLPLNFTGGISFQNPSVTITLKGTPLISGFDTNMDGTAGDPTADVSGFSVAAPGTVADLLGELTGAEATKVVGVGGTPSLEVGVAADVNAIVDAVRNSANVVLTNSSYSGLHFGSGPAGTATIALREGDVKFSGTTQGAGILVVTGDLEMTGNFRYDGVIIVLGDILAGIGTAQVNGALVQGPAGTSFTSKGTFDVRFSGEAIALARSVSGRYVAFNGWQEIAR